jgi:hypothetical protein
MPACMISRISEKIRVGKCLAGEHGAVSSAQSRRGVAAPKFTLVGPKPSALQRGACAQTRMTEPGQCGDCWLSWEMWSALVRPSQARCAPADAVVDVPLRSCNADAVRGRRSGGEKGRMHPVYGFSSIVHCVQAQQVAAMA